MAAAALGLQALFNPLMLGQQALPTFSGKPQNWLTFRRLMDQWISTLDPHHLAHDALLFQLLRKSLDKTSRWEFDAGLAQEHNVGFWGYWEELKDRFED